MCVFTQCAPDTTSKHINKRVLERMGGDMPINMIIKFKCTRGNKSMTSPAVLNVRKNSYTIKILLIERKKRDSDKKLFISEGTQRRET